MASVIDPETLCVDDLPGIWTPVQWELTEEERNAEIEEQARASLLWSVCVPECILRLVLDECSIERAFEPPSGYDAEMQGEWDDSLVTFRFKRPIRMNEVERDPQSLYVEYDFGERGHWAFIFEPEKVIIERI